MTVEFIGKTHSFGCWLFFFFFFWLLPHVGKEKREQRPKEADKIWVNKS